MPNNIPQVGIEVITIAIDKDGKLHPNVLNNVIRGSVPDVTGWYLDSERIHYYISTAGPVVTTCKPISMIPNLNQHVHFYEWVHVPHGELCHVPALDLYTYQGQMGPVILFYRAHRVARIKITKNNLASIPDIEKWIKAVTGKPDNLFESE